jgi:hypothetical protein
MTASWFSHRTVRIIDIGLIIWLLVCLALGVAVTKRLNRLGTLGDGVISAGNGVNDAASALNGLRDTPLIGGTIGSIADKIVGIGDSTIAAGNTGKEAIWRAALTVGILLTLLPTLPLILIWLPIRISWGRERASVRAALAADEPGVREYLARQTVEMLKFRELRRISADPWSDVREGRFSDLAAIELGRLGLTDPGAQSSVPQ